jgi:hypothetical protein
VLQALVEFLDDILADWCDMRTEFHCCRYSVVDESVKTSLSKSKGKGPDRFLRLSGPYLTAGVLGRRSVISCAGSNSAQEIIITIKRFS